MDTAQIYHGTDAATVHENDEESNESSDEYLSEGDAPWSDDSFDHDEEVGDKNSLPIMKGKKISFRNDSNLKKRMVSPNPQES